MNKRVLLLLAILVPFSVLSAYAMYQHGYMGVWEAGTTSSASVQILVDLVIVCVLFSTWMFKDATARGANPWPYLVITLFAGSFGPLLYLLVREWNSKEGSEPRPA